MQLPRSSLVMSVSHPRVADPLLIPSSQVHDWAMKNTEEIERLEGEVAEQKEAISERNTTIAAQTDTIQAKVAEIERQQNLILAHRGAIQERDAIILAKDQNVRLISSLVFGGDLHWVKDDLGQKIAGLRNTAGSS
jgi:uncharacterized coiled-coil protein SlyX